MRTIYLQDQGLFTVLPDMFIHVLCHVNIVTSGRWPMSEGEGECYNQPADIGLGCCTVKKNTFIFNLKKNPKQVYHQNLIHILWLSIYIYIYI